jgi:hypothetical protein
LTLETPQGQAKVDLNQRPTIQDDSLRLLGVADLEAGQIVHIEARKTPQGALIAKQVSRKPVNAPQTWCADNADTCREATPLLERLTSQCRPGDLQCARIQQNVIELQNGLKQLMQRIQALKDHCGDGREASACRQLMQACKDHPVVCTDLKIRPANGNSGPGNGPQRPRSNQGPRQQ